MKTFIITENAETNATVLPIEAQKPAGYHQVAEINRLVNFSYFTCCKISDQIGRTYPTPATLADYCRERDNRSHVLTLDNLGNFVSLLPVGYSIAQKTEVRCEPIDYSGRVHPAYDLVKNDGQLHEIWRDGGWSIKGFSGEHGNISLTLFRGDAAQYCTHNLRNLEDHLTSAVRIHGTESDK